MEITRHIFGLTAEDTDHQLTLNLSAGQDSRMYFVFVYTAFDGTLQVLKSVVGIENWADLICAEVQEFLTQQWSGPLQRAVAASEDQSLISTYTSILEHHKTSIPSVVTSLRDAITEAGLEDAA